MDSLILTAGPSSNPSETYTLTQRGGVVAGAFYLPYTQVSGLYPYTAILAATAGKWADLQSDGSNWIIMASN